MHGRVLSDTDFTPEVVAAVAEYRPEWQWSSPPEPPPVDQAELERQRKRAVLLEEIEKRRRKVS